VKSWIGVMHDDSPSPVCAPYPKRIRRTINFDIGILIYIKDSVLLSRVYIIG
jgi:hypothetical protein